MSSPSKLTPPELTVSLAVQPDSKTSSALKSDSKATVDRPSLINAVGDAIMAPNVSLTDIASQNNLPQAAKATVAVMAETVQEAIAVANANPNASVDQVVRSVIQSNSYKNKAVDLSKSEDLTKATVAATQNAIAEMGPTTVQTKIMTPSTSLYSQISSIMATSKPSQKTIDAIEQVILRGKPTVLAQELQAVLPVVVTTNLPISEDQLVRLATLSKKVAEVKAPSKRVSTVKLPSKRVSIVKLPSKRVSTIKVPSFKRAPKTPSFPAKIDSAFSKLQLKYPHLTDAEILDKINSL